MARPTEEVVLWAAQDVTLPSLAGPNKVLPISDLINKGWDMNQKPAADEFNYLLNNYAKWLVYLDEKSGGASPDAPEVDSIPSTTPLRDPDGKGCFKGIKASNTTNANSFNMIDTYNSKTAVSVSIDGNEIGNFVYNGLLSSGDGKSGLVCNTAGTHYGTVVGDVVGNADTATKWKTARTLTLVGPVSGSTSLDGSGNVTLITTLQGSGVSILTGTVANGETIPLPSGYTQEQCKWMVSIADDNPANLIWDIKESGAHMHYKFVCRADSNRVVTAQAIHGYNENLQYTNAIANYMIIGFK